MDKSLATLLRSLQTSHSPNDATRLLPTATSLLARLSNPLNISLLSSQLLSHPYLYPHPTNLTSCRRIFSTFYTAATRFAASASQDDKQILKSNLSRRSWTKAVIEGADDRSPRWRHVLLIGGILLGFEGQKGDGGRENSTIPHDLQQKLEVALVAASNLALHSAPDSDPNSHLCVVWVLNLMFTRLSDFHRSQLDYNVLLPVLVDAAFFSPEGLEHGYWLGVIDMDVRQIPGNKFSWSLGSASGRKLQELKGRELMTSLGQLARLIAHAVEYVSDVGLVLSVVDRISEFSRNLALSWRQNKLSEVDRSEEGEFLDRETVEGSMPALFQVLTNTLFATVICLRSAVGRLLIDASLSSQNAASTLATKCLHILRDTYFIAHRLGDKASSQYMFVQFTAIDILNQYPQQAEELLTSTRPSVEGQIPAHPLERLHDLFFLNISEHFTLCLSPAVTENVLLRSAMVYVSATGDKQLNEIYEAAHSVLLAIFVVPRNAELASRHIPAYIDTLLGSFPDKLSPRQFRLATKSIVRISAPPSQVSMMNPYLQATLLEMLRERMSHASEDMLPAPDVGLGPNPTLSEKSVLLLSVLDSLPFLPIWLLQEWLFTAAEHIHKIANPAQRNMCQMHFWQVLSGGEMDVGRASVCVAWWTSRGGKELVLYGEIPEEEDFVTARGALQVQDNKL